MASIITLTTDFGLLDSYVGCMKGVILNIIPSVTVVDVCHQVRAQDIRRGAYSLWSSAKLFPQGTIHVVVVDPGVGSERKAVAIEAGGQFFVGPDNGVLWPAISCFDDFVAYELTNSRWHREEISSTFHGRDIFSPVAAHLANGTNITELGPPVTRLQRLELFNAKAEGECIQGRVLLADHFGNLATNIPVSMLPSPDKYNECRIQVGSHLWNFIATTFSDVEAEQKAAYVNSFGVLELAIRNGSAEKVLSITQDEPVTVRW